MKFVHLSTVLSLCLVLFFGCRIQEEEDFSPEEVFTRVYNNDSFDNFEAVDFVQTEDDGYVILARYYNQEEDISEQPYVLRVDSKGSFLWDTYRNELTQDLGEPFGKLFQTPNGEYAFFTHAETNTEININPSSPRVRDVKVGEVKLVTFSDIAGGDLSTTPLPYTNVRPMGMSIGRENSIYLHLWVSNLLEQQAILGRISKDSLPTPEDYPQPSDYPNPNDYPTIADFEAFGCNQEINLADSSSFVDSVIVNYPKPSNYPTQAEIQAVQDSLTATSNNQNLTQQERDSLLNSLQQELDALQATKDSIDNAIIEIAIFQYQDYLAGIEAFNVACDSILFQISRFTEITDSLDYVTDSLDRAIEDFQTKIDSLDRLSANYFIKFNTSGILLSEFAEVTENSLVSPEPMSLFIEPFETASATNVEAVTMLYDGEERYWAFLDFNNQEIVAEGYPYDDPISTATLHFKQARESGLCGTVVSNGNDLFTHTNLEIEVNGESATFSTGTNELGTFHELQDELETVEWNSQTLGGERFFVILATDHTTKINIMAFRPESRFSGGRIVLGEVAPYEPGMLRPTSDGGVAVLGTTYVADRFRRIVLFKMDKDKINFLKGG